MFPMPRRRIAPLQTLGASLSEVKEMWCGGDGEKEGIAIGVDFDDGDTSTTEWYTLVLVLSFLRRKLY